MVTDPDLTAPIPTLPPEASLHCGVDVVAISRIADLLAEFGESFRERVFAPAEQRYCERQGFPPQHYAARWAVKEAFVKAITAEAQPVPFRDVGVTHDGGEPTLVLTSRARAAVETTVGEARAERTATAVSLSHDRETDRAIGQVVLLGGESE